MERRMLWLVAMQGVTIRSVAIVVVSLVLGCSNSSGAQPCNEDPWECAAGQTCWPKDESTFECLNSGSGTAGSVCQDSVGIATCGDGLACLQTSEASGRCAQYCDNTDTRHACPAGLTCQTALVVGSSIQICVGGSSTIDAGDGSDAFVE
jgi:hypothetical protein